jgi:hypothetical protein
MIMLRSRRLKLYYRLIDVTHSSTFSFANSIIKVYLQLTCMTCMVLGVHYTVYY